MHVAESQSILLSYIEKIAHMLVKVEQGHFETAILILHNFFVFYYGYRCLEALQYVAQYPDTSV